jgi:hypothetical protein
MVRCALPVGHSISKQDQYGTWYTFQGALGVASEWETGSCGVDCQQQLSACMMAHVNTSGQHIALMLDGDSPSLGWGQDPNYPFQEGSFFGNIFASPPQAYYCEGRDFDRGVVQGRIGANQSGAPYSNPFGTGGFCNQNCTVADIPNQNDGYKACRGFNHVITVWRDFDPNTKYTFTNHVTYSLIDVAGFSTANGGAVQEWQGTGATNQKWYIRRRAPKVYEIASAYSGKCLEVGGFSTSAETPLQQWTCNGTQNQLWQLNPKGQGWYEVRSMLTVNSANPMCMDVYQTNNANGTRIQQYNCGAYGYAAQQWMIQLGN